jgi:hypothetical protein
VRSKCSRTPGARRGRSGKFSGLLSGIRKNQKSGTTANPGFRKPRLPSHSQTAFGPVWGLARAGRLGGYQGLRREHELVI